MNTKHGIGIFTSRNVVLSISNWRWCPLCWKKCSNCAKLISYDGYRRYESRSGIFACGFIICKKYLFRGCLPFDTCEFLREVFLFFIAYYTQIVFIWSDRCTCLVRYLSYYAYVTEVILIHYTHTHNKNGMTILCFHIIITFYWGYYQEKDDNECRRKKR